MADRLRLPPVHRPVLCRSWLAGEWAELAKFRPNGLPSQRLLVCSRSARSPTGKLAIWHDTQSVVSGLRTLALTHDNYVAEANLGEVLV